MTKNVLAVIGMLTVAWHTTGFILGVIEGIKGRKNNPYPRLRLVWSVD